MNDITWKLYTYATVEFPFHCEPFLFGSLIPRSASLGFRWIRRSLRRASSSLIYLLPSSSLISCSLITSLGFTISFDLTSPLKLSYSLPFSRLFFYLFYTLSATFFYFYLEITCFPLPSFIHSIIFFAIFTFFILCVYCYPCLFRHIFKTLIPF